MPRTRPLGPLCCPDLTDVNDAIRRLMSRPPDPARAEEYGRLLELWATACPQDGSCWTTAA
ncbi:hypothetical protein OG234_13065 [Streptomyces sp. NBC_01420]|uniref:hypothetical protein n=1 Tax=Streptomyces sp. NBC_01420 TaxID=2903858 RepID=UPI00324512CB